MAVVAGAGQALAGDRPLLGADAGLQRVEEREAESLLEFGVALELDVRGPPEVVQALALAGQQPVPARVPCLDEGCDGLVPQGGQRTLARPAVGEELDQAQPLPGLEVGGDGHATDVGRALAQRLRPRWAFDEVVHPGGEDQLAPFGGVGEDDARDVVGEVLGLQRRLEHRSCPWVGGLRRARLVRDQLGLDDDTDGSLEGLDLVQDRGGGALHQRDEAR
jgi:hypothetical protein